MNKFNKFFRTFLTTCLVLVLAGSPWHLALAVDDTTPSVIIYEGKLLDAASAPVTSEHSLRFSLWSSEDWQSGDASGGDINTSATNYGGWVEEHTVTPDSAGIFSIKLGSQTALPSISFTTHKFIQFEIKVSGAPNTSYELMDPTGDNGSDTVDRQTIGSLFYAKNTERLDDKEIGTSEDDIVLLGSGGTWSISQIPGGTDQDVFILDADDTISGAGTGSITLQFGSTLNKVLSYNIDDTRFELNDDLDIQGSLNISGALQFSGSSDGEITYDDTEDTFDFDANRIINIADPVNPQDVATKDYVDNATVASIWKDPVEHTNQMVDGGSGGLRAGGKIFVSDETLVNENDTIAITYNSGVTSFTLTAKDSPIAASCEFKSGVAAVDNIDLATSILSAIDNCASAADFAGQSTSSLSAVFVIHDAASTIGNGTISPSGSGFIDIDMHEGEAYAAVVTNETRVCREDQLVYIWDSTTSAWAQSTHTQNTDTGTDQTSFAINSDGNQVLLDSTGLTADRTVTFDDADTVVVGEDNTQTLTNKTIDGDDNTLQDIAWSSLTTRNESLLLIPQYPGLSVEEDGSNNIATLKLDSDSINDHNFYVLSSAESSLNDLDIFVRVQLPDDFVSWQATPLQIYLKSDSTESTDNQIDVFVNDTSNNPVTLVGGSDLLSTIAGVWFSKSITFSGSPVWTAGDFITIRLSMQSRSNNNIRIGEIKLNYIGK